MPTVQHAFAWLTSLPPNSLYAAAFALAFIENIFPPFPSDLFIGICAFVAAPGQASLGITYLSVLLGNVAGGAGTYGLARRYGADGLHARLARRGWLAQEKKLEAMYKRYGIAGMFIGRMIPGVRGVVPMVAGALRVSAPRTIAVIAAAAAIWYGLLTGLAYRVGGNWDAYAHDISALGKWGAIIGGALAAAAVVVGALAYRKKRSRK